MKLTKGKIFVAIAALSMVITSCKKDAVFDQARYDDLLKASFPVENVDPFQTWTTLSTAMAEVSINLDYGVTYDVGLYLENPIGATQATRVYEKKVKSGESFSTAFTYRTASPVVYVGVFDPQGRGMAQVVPIKDGRAEADINTNITASARQRASEDASVYGQYVKTLNDYLNPVVSGFVTNQITIAGMQAYEAFTDADINAQNHIFSVNAPRKRAGRRAGESIQGDAYYKLTAGENPSDGEVKNIMYNGTVVGTLQFGGSEGGAAVASSSGDYSAKIYRKYYIFKPLVDAGNQLYFEHESKATSGIKAIVKDETDNSIKIGQWGVTWQNTLYTMDITGGHTYKIYFEDNSLMGAWGLKYHFQGKTMDGGGSGGGGGDSGGGTEEKGDGHHYRVAAGTTITKKFNLTGSSGIFNDIVVYFEGKVHLNDNTLNNVTLVVANGGEVIIDGSTNMSNRGRFVVLAGGKITSTQNASFTVTNGSPCYNAGLIQMTSGELNVNGCDFYNSADGTVKVYSLCNTSGGKFTNFGVIEATTNMLAGDAYNCHVINGCHMKFTGDAGVGGITMLDNSRLDVLGQLFITGREENGSGRNNTLYNHSVIKAGSIKFRNATFVGPTASGEYAIVKTSKELVDWANTLNSYNNVYWDIVVSEFYDYNNNQLDVTDIYGAPWHILNNGDWCTSGITNYVKETTALATYSIPAGKCTGDGYNGELNPGGGKPEPTPLTMRYMFEDNYPDTGDYDLNDCVFSVTPVLDENNPKRVTVTVRAEASGAQKNIGAAIRLVGVTTSMLSSYQCTQAFATPPSNVGTYNNIPDGQFTVSGDPNDRISLVMLLFKDLHYALNQELSSTGTVQRFYYNTQHVGGTNYGVATPKTAVYVFEFNTEADAQRLLDQSTYDAFIVEEYNGSYWEVHTVQNGFKGSLVLHYDVHQNTYQEYLNAYIRSSTGNIPWAVMVPGTVAYPYEWIKINDAYPNFTGWAQDRTTNTDWYKSPVNADVYPLP